jgi:hypothetical protein
MNRTHYPQSLAIFSHLCITLSIALTTSAQTTTWQAAELAPVAQKAQIRPQDHVADQKLSWLQASATQQGASLSFTIPNLPAGRYELWETHVTSPLGSWVIFKHHGQYIGEGINQYESGKRAIHKRYVDVIEHSQSGDLKLEMILLSTPYKDHGELTAQSIEMIRLGDARPPDAPRPVAGASFSPEYAAKPYNPDGSDIPADALDRKDYPTMEAWIADMEKQNKPGKIGSGTYTLDKKAKGPSLTQSIYGYDTGKGRPVIDGNNRGTYFFLGASNITLQYLHIKNIGYGLVGLDNWLDWTLGTKSTWNAWAFSPEVMKGKIVDDHLDNLNILDCHFTNVGVAMIIVQEFHGVHNVHIARNHSSGGLGFVTLRTLDFDNIYFYQNVLNDHDQADNKGNHVTTLCFLGTDDWQGTMKNRHVRVEHNQVTNVTSKHNHYKLNAAVFADIRNCSDVSISYNILKNLVSTVGHSDCNTVYSKASELIIKGNYFENCGSNLKDKQRMIGSEGGCLTLKGETNNAAKFGTIVEDCTFVAGTIDTVPMVLFGHGGILRNCTFKDWQWKGDYWSRSAMINKYSGKAVTLINPTFINCGGDKANAFAVSKSNAAMIGWHKVNFDNNRSDIFKGVDYIYDATNEQGQTLKNKPEK